MVAEEDERDRHPVGVVDVAEVAERAVDGRNAGVGVGAVAERGLAGLEQDVGVGFELVLDEGAGALRGADVLLDLVEQRLLALHLLVDGADVAEELEEAVAPERLLGVLPAPRELRLRVGVGGEGADGVGFEDVRGREVEAPVVEDGEDAVRRGPVPRGDDDEVAPLGEVGPETGAAGGLHLREPSVEEGRVVAEVFLGVVLGLGVGDAREGARGLDVPGEEGLVAVAEREPGPGLGASDGAPGLAHERVELLALVGVGELAEGGEEDRERGEPLLPVDDVGAGVVGRLDEDDGPEEVRGQGVDLSGVAVGVAVGEGEHVVEEFFGLLGGPGVGTLVGRDREDVVARKHLRERSGLAQDVGGGGGGSSCGVAVGDADAAGDGGGDEGGAVLAEALDALFPPWRRAGGDGRSRRRGGPRWLAARRRAGRAPCRV